MAQPPSYNRGYDFTSFQTNNPDEPIPAVELESEFDSIKQTLDAVLVNMAILQRDDTELANQIVTPESFSQETIALTKASSFNIRGSWSASTAYAINDLVEYNSATYIAVSAHTSSANFSSDSGNWVLLANAAIDTTSSAVDQFEGTGSQTAFTTQYSYNSVTDVLVFVNGALQTPTDDYSISNTTVTFTSPPPAPAVAGRENVIVWGPSVTTIAAQVAAANSAGAAAASASAAAQSETNAQSAQALAESARDDSQTARDDSQTARTASQAAQALSEGARDTAQNHRDDAQKLATNAEDSQFTLSDGTTTGYSALHYKEKAEDAEAAALLSKNAAAQSETNALNYSNNANTQAGLAAASATSASGYADTAEDEKDLAVLARQAAESARDATLTAYDNFDDRYLGAKTSDPTTDNDGNSLIAGSLYFNSTTSAMMVYSGSAWVAAYADGATLVAKAGDTMSGNLTVNANINANSLNVDGNITADGMTIDGGDFVVDGQSVDNALIVDYSTNRVGINLGAGNTPQANFHVKGGQRWETTTGGNILELQHYSGYSFIYRSNGDLRLSGQGAASQNYLALTNSGGFTFAGNTVYHTGNLDSILDLGITDGTNGQVLQTDGAGGMSFTTITGFSGAFADLSGKPTTIAGYGITDVFDGSGNLLVGKTVTDVGTAGHTLGSSGYVYHTRAGDIQFLNRTGSDGVHTYYYRDGADKGNIGVYSNKLQIGQGNANVQFSNAEDAIIPSNGSGTLNDNAIDLGTTSARFNDIHYGGVLNANASDYQIKVTSGSNQPWYLRSLSNGSFGVHLNGTGDIANFTSSGASINGDLSLGDGNRAKFGDDADIQIWHSGTSNLISSNADLNVGKGVTGGSFVFRLAQPSGAGGNTLEIDSNSTGGHQRINAASTNYPLEIQYNGGTKISIDANGVDTFGTLVNDGHLLVVNNGVSNQGDNNTHFNYQDTGVNYIRGTLTYSSSPFRIASGGIQRSAHNNGHLEGGYNNIGANGLNTNPIFTIGSNYNPASTTLSNMYGIGFCRGDASFIPQTSSAHWGQYVAADGDARIFLNGSTGAGLFNGNVTAYASDERLKENIKPIPNALEKVCKLNGVTFDWKDDCEEKGFTPSMKHETGVIAQNVATQIPDAISPAPFNSEYLTVDKEKIIPVLIEAIKELKAEIETLKKG